MILRKTEKKSVQKNIKRSIERGVIIKEITSLSDVEIYYNLQKQYRNEINLIPYSKENMIKGFKIMQSVGSSGFIAWYNDKPIGAISFSTFNGFIQESGIARTEFDTKNHLYSQDLLKWQIIEWGVNHHCKYYDLAGVKMINRSPKE